MLLVHTTPPPRPRPLPLTVEGVPAAASFGVAPLLGHSGGTTVPPACSGVSSELPYFLDFQGGMFMIRF